jgi:hypothetical protein
VGRPTKVADRKALALYGNANLGVESMEPDVVFPISICFDDGEVQEFQNCEDLELDLEYFDSEKATDCIVTDKLARRVRLEVYSLRIKELSVAEDH